MRRELLYEPALLFERVSQKLSERSRLRKLRGTCASWLKETHIDSMELVELARNAGAIVYYDIGANIGTWTLMCRALVPNSRIVAFEPVSAHVRLFRENT